MQNELIFITHICVLLGATMGAFLLSKHALRALVCVYVALANLFVVKQMMLGGLIACGGGMYIVGSMCGLLLAQTVWGKDFARKTLYLSFIISILFFVLSWFQCAYAPAGGDMAHELFLTVLGRVPRITLASLVAHIVSQALTLSLQAILLALTSQRGVMVVSMATMFIGQVLDSALFFTGSFYGYASLGEVGQMVGVSVGIKTLMIVLSSLLVTWAQKRKEAGSV